MPGAGWVLLNSAGAATCSTASLFIPVGWESPNPQGAVTDVVVDIPPRSPKDDVRQRPASAQLQLPLASCRGCVSRRGLIPNDADNYPGPTAVRAAHHLELTVRRFILDLPTKQRVVLDF
jgi:hypothetical protein